MKKSVLMFLIVLIVLIIYGSLIWMMPSFGFIQTNPIIEKNFSELKLIRQNEGEDKGVKMYSAVYNKNNENTVRVVISKESSKSRAAEGVDDIMDELIENHGYESENKVINGNEVIWTYEYNDFDKYLETIIVWRSKRNVISLRENIHFLRLSNVEPGIEGFIFDEPKELLNAYLKKFPSDL